MLKRYRNRHVYDTVWRDYLSTGELRQRLLRGERVTGHENEKDETVLCLLRVLKDDIEQGQGPSPEAFQEFMRSYHKG